MMMKKKKRLWLLYREIVEGAKIAHDELVSAIDEKSKEKILNSLLDNTLNAISIYGKIRKEMGEEMENIYPEDIENLKNKIRLFFLNNFFQLFWKDLSSFRNDFV